ncbi:MAG: alkaline shock response membrane anchor protein AmaP [Clostridia bacterium]|nr:alkaline shock response membrane anchor protein AmaP [Clostridia bacterium]
MKLSVGKRILMFLHWLLSLLIVAAFAVYVIAPVYLMRYYNMVEAAIGLRYVKVIGIALLAIYAVLAIIQIYLIFKRKRRSERGFITMDSSDTGKVRIAISAIEQMVRQSVTNIDGITEMKINIDNQDDAIVITVRASILNGCHVPTITMNMQRAIRQFVEMNCGVAVRSVLINIHSVTNAGEAPKKHRLGRDKNRIDTAAPTLPEFNAPQPQADSQPQSAPQPKPAWHIEPEEAEAPRAAEAPSDEEAPASQPEPEPEPAPAQEAPAYDFDKPYESEFAKDLAAMKAAEAAEAEAWEDGEADREEDAL